MKEFMTFAVFVLGLIGQGCAMDCCSAYTDPLGGYHESQMCSQYCCINIGLDYKICCDDIRRQVPATQRDNQECAQNWMKEHMWETIVGGLLSLAVLICICTCCCCCCSCCRNKPQQFIVHSGAPPASTTVAMANTNMVTHNQAHMGYNQ